MRRAYRVRLFRAHAESIEITEKWERGIGYGRGSGKGEIWGGGGV